MKHADFVEKLNGSKWHHTRVNVATNYCTDDQVVIPERPARSKCGRLSSISIARTVFCYDDKDLYTEDYGVLVAVVKSGAGQLWCDRFVPVVDDTPKEA